VTFLQIVQDDFGIKMSRRSPSLNGLRFILRRLRQPDRYERSELPEMAAPQ
jgi:hypothetical protein